MNNKEQKKKESLVVSPYSRLISLPVHSENIFYFPEGLPAFEHVKEFIFIHKADTSPFVFMNALAPSDLSFVCVDPFLIYSNYKLRINHSDVEHLNLKRPEDALVLSIVTANSDVMDTTANLQGPLVINFQASIGKQIICDGMEYPVRYRIWDGLQRLEQKEHNIERVPVKAAG